MPKPFKKELIDIKEYEFEYQQRGEQPVLLSDFYSRGIRDHFLEAFKLKIPGYDYIFTMSSRGYVKSAIKRVLLAKLKVALRSDAYAARVLDLSVRLMKDFGLLADEINATMAKSKLTNAELAGYWQKMDAAFIRLIPWFWVPYYPSAENFITDKVKKGLEKHKKEIEKITDLNDALLALVFPVKVAAFQRQQVDFHALANIAETIKRFEHNPAFKKLAEAYLEKYSWTTTFLLMPLLPLTKKQLIGRIKRTNKEKSSDEFLLQQKAKRNNAKKAEKIMRLVKNDAELVKNINLARDFGYVLTAGVEEALRSCAKFLPYLQLVARRIGVPFRDMRLLLSDEIFTALQTGAKFDSNELRRREAGYIMAVIGNEQYVRFGPDAASLSYWVDKELEFKVDANIKEIKGQVACRGNAKGIVRVALSPASSHALRDGEILVCPMTNPDYVPAMKRSGAIVTDEGGLLSHAAIMSREFGKPCIIGTKIATKVLHDGDLVEVDAEKGVVRILDK
jgi:phosphoenolpyruvate synthase/pyruvate phosphate dikinase